ncbi:MAG: phosphomannomutase/phosphoglucomutase [Patescibacteria group bacterium]|nr:phosphomannomutase/phosphoglucomutase [Patescibacteria group bacterium]
MKIILDFDDTIFNTHKLIRNVSAVFEKAGFAEEEFFEAHRECKEKVGDFNPKTIIDLLNKVKPFDKIETKKKINSILDNSKDFMYPDFFNFAKGFNKKDLILLSFGEVNFQKIKIKNSEINSFFSKVIITKKNKTEELKPICEKYSEEKIFFIDDKAEQIDKIKEKLPQIITMKTERPQGRHIDIESKLTDYIVKNLDEAKNIINQIIYNKMDQSIFKAYDIRGEYPNQLNEKVSFRIGQVFANYAQRNNPSGEPKKIIVGRDIRLSSENISQALINGITSTGIDVIDIGLASSPHFNYSAAHLNFPAMVVTASHMEKHFNGFKMAFAENITLTKKQLLEIKRTVLSNKEIEVSQTKGSIEKIDILDDYIAEIRQFIKFPFKKLKVVMDAGNCMAGLSIEKVFENTELEVVPLYTELDGNFPNHETNPKIEKNQRDLKKKIIEEEADLGFMFDGDADRFYAFDRNGEVISPSFVSALVGRYLIRNYSGNKVIIEVRTGNVVKDLIEEAGGEILVVKPWYVMIKIALGENPDAVFGSETSGHYLFQDFYKIDDGILTALIFLQAISVEEKSVDAILGELRKKYFIIEEINFEFKCKEKGQEKLVELERYYKERDGKILKIDGLSVIFDDWHFNLRASESEPLLRLNLEANSKELMEEKTREVSELIKKT